MTDGIGEQATTDECRLASSTLTNEARGVWGGTSWLSDEWSWEGIRDVASSWNKGMKGNGDTTTFHELDSLHFQWKDHTLDDLLWRMIFIFIYPDSLVINVMFLYSSEHRISDSLCAFLTFVLLATLPFVPSSTPERRREESDDVDFTTGKLPNIEEAGEGGGWDKQ